MFLKCENRSGLRTREKRHETPAGTRNAAKNALITRMYFVPYMFDGFSMPNK